ncbi:MAG: hypothetical protein INF12_15090 [Methylobacterium sp.]|nr:hypothetical protein [Methylobacterium sp.]
MPVRDSAILERKAQENEHKTELKTILFDHKKKREGIQCAVTKGGRGNVQNPESQPNPVTGSNAVQGYAPGMPASPQPGATGGTLSEQQLGSETGKVISGVEATQGTLQATEEIYRARSSEIGSAKTVMESFDQNTSIRIQNGLGWNQAIATANLLVQALNALNLANQSDTSQGARVLVGPRPPILPGRSCPIGMSGTGTPTDPCRPAQCSTTPTGTPADPACITRRYVDSDGNVLMYLEIASRRVIETPIATTSARPGARTITEAELLEALAASRARAAGQN